MDGDEDKDGLQEIYEEEAVKVISLSDGEEQEVEEVEADFDGMELPRDSEDSGEEDDGAMGGIQPLRDDSMTCFTEHKGPVFAVDVNSVSSLVASGSQDDRALVWSLIDGSVAFECNGHTDSVTCVSFSHDDKYLATSDLAGHVQVWQCSSGKCVWRFETPGEVEWLLWHGGAHVLLAGTGDGDGWVWRIPSGECKTIPSHGSGNMAAILMPNGKSSCFGYTDGCIKLWDLKTVSLLSSYNPPPNQMSPVTCLSVHPNGSLVVSGHIDGTARLYSISNNNIKLLAMFSLNEQKSGDKGGGGEEGAQSTEDDEDMVFQSVEAVGFLSSHNLVLAGFVTGSLAIWDVPTQKLRHICKPDKEEVGLVRMCISGRGPFVYSCYSDGVIRQWNLLTAQCVGEWHGHSAGLLDIRITRDEDMILSSSDDATVRLYKTTPTPDKLS